MTIVAVAAEDFDEAASSTAHEKIISANFEGKVWRFIAAAPPFSAHPSYWWCPPSWACPHGGEMLSRRRGYRRRLARRCRRQSSSPASRSEIGPANPSRRCRRHAEPGPAHRLTCCSAEHRRFAATVPASKALAVTPAH